MMENRLESAVKMATKTAEFCAAVSLICCGVVLMVRFVGWINELADYDEFDNGDYDDFEF